MANATFDSIRLKLESVAAEVRNLPSRMVFATDPSADHGGNAGAVIPAQRRGGRCRGGGGVAAPVMAGLAAVGAATLASWGASAVCFLLPYVLPSRLALFKRDDGRGRAWAVVTGASDGIGKGFAQELAAAGFDVLLVARNRDKLAGVAREIEREFPGTRTKILITDAQNIDQRSFLAELDAAVTGLPGPVTVLINNVGRVNAHIDVLSKQDDSDLTNVVVVNDLFPTIVTKHLLPILEKNQPSLILNVGSYASEIALPYYGVYAGSKAYNKVWSESLFNELRLAGMKDIECQHLLVGDVHTNSNRSPVGLFCPSARKLARAALRVSTRRPVIAPYFPHAFRLATLSRLPCFAYRWITRRAARRLKARAQKWVDDEAA